MAKKIAGWTILGLIAATLLGGTAVLVGVLPAILIWAGSIAFMAVLGLAVSWIQ